METKKTKRQFEILENSMFKFEGDDVYTEIENFLHKRIVKTQSK